MPPENPSATSHPREPVIIRLAHFLAVLGGLVVVAIAVLVTTSVLMRWLGGEGVNGDFELVQMGLALAVFAFLPLCEARHGNVVVDTFTTRWSRAAQVALDVLWDLVYAAFAAFIAWRLSLGAFESAASHTTSMVLGLPVHFAIAGCAAMAAFLALVCIAAARQRGRISP